MIHKVFFSSSIDREKAKTEELNQLLERLEEISAGLTDSRTERANFHALASEQRRIVDVLENLDPRMNRAARKMYS